MRSIVRAGAVAATVAAFLAGCGGGGGGGGIAGAAAPGGGSTSSGGSTSAAPIAPVPLSIAIETPLGVESGHVEIEYTLTDSASPLASITVEYTLDGGATWTPATQGIGSDGMVGLRTGPPPGVRHRFVWDTFRDLGESFHLAAQVRISVTAAGQSTGGATFDFPVNNATAWFGVPIARGPYLQDVTPSSATIVWRTTQPAAGSVQWGETPALGRFAPGNSSGTEQAVTLTGLDPGREYWYHVTANGAPISPTERFRTADAPWQTAFSFIVYGDSGAGNTDQWDVAQRMEMTQADFALHVGDIVYPSGEQRDYDPRFFSPYRKMLSRIPCWPAMGNHDVVSWLGKPFLDNFHLPSAHSGSEKYYTFQWGHAQFFCLDTSFPQLVTPLLPQHSWFVNELLASQATWKFVYFHHPPYSSGGHGSDHYVRAVLSPFIEQAQVDIVFNGHDHDYERTTPRRDYAHTPRGVTYVVTGAAGALSTSPHGPSSFTAVFAQVPHFTHVRIDGNTLHLEAIRSDGTVFDRFDIVK